MLAFALLMAIRHKADTLTSPPKRPPTHQREFMVRWSLQEIRRIAWRLIQRCIEPAFVIAWSVWRRCHQAHGTESPLQKRNPQL